MATKSIHLGGNAFVAKQETFLPVDAYSEKKSLQKQGKENGQVNSPDSQASHLDAVEQGIARKIAQTASLTQGALSLHFVSFSASLLPIVNTWEPMALINTIQSKPEAVKTNLNNILNHYTTKSAIKVPAWNGAKQAYKTFRQEHGLIRPPDYLPMKSIIFWFFFIIVVEAALNATLLWELTGILTAFGQTALITSANVLFGASLVGLCFRYKNYAFWRARLLVLFCIPAVLAVLTFNFGVGHYRDALVEAKVQGEKLSTNLDWDNAAEVDDLDFVDYTKKAMESMKVSPFKIDSVLSVLLIIVGIGFFGFATHKWYSMFDPHPGHRKRALALEAKHKDYQKLVVTTRAEMEQKIKDARDHVSDERTKVTNMRTLHNDLMGRAKALQASYANWVLVLERTQNYLLTVYRDSNRQARSEPAPKHFNDTLHIDNPLTESPEFNPPNLQNVKQVVDAVREADVKIQKIATKYLAKI